MRWTPALAVLITMTAVAPPSREAAVATRAIEACGAESRAVRGTASFVLGDSTGRRRLEFGDGNLVFCRSTSATMTWIRLAVSPVKDGADGPHLDIDVCHLGAGGEFAPMEARAQPCPGGRTWAAWWHDGTAAVYANRASAAPCTLVLTVEAEQVRGTFSCRGLVTADGRGSVDLLDGRFDCVVEPREPPRQQESALLSRPPEA
jgi:hypothetical protein